MAVVKVSRTLGSAAVVEGVGSVKTAVDGAAEVDGAVDMEGAAETPGTGSDIPDTRVLCVLRRKYE